MLDVLPPHMRNIRMVPFFSKNKPTLTYHHHLKFIVYIRVHSWSVHYMGLDKDMVTYIHHYNTIQSISLPEKFFALCLFFPTFPATDVSTVSIVLSHCFQKPSLHLHSLVSKSSGY